MSAPKKIDYLGTELSEKQCLVAFALAAGGKITKIKDPVGLAVRHYIKHPASGVCVAVTNQMIAILQKKGVIDNNLEFTQPSLFFN